MQNVPPAIRKAARDAEGAVLAMSMFGASHHGGRLCYSENERMGTRLLKNFLVEVCHVNNTWTMENFIESEVTKIKEQVGDRKVLCALSGGVDSSVVATLIHRAIGDRLTCIFVDHGL